MHDVAVLKLKLPVSERLQFMVADAGVTIPVLYHHFGNREGLVRAAHVVRLETVIQRITGVPIGTVMSRLARGRERLRALGATVQTVTGNLKFDAEPDAAQVAQGQAWRAALHKPVCLLASSREGEEAQWLQAFQQQATPNSEPSWFGFPLILKESSSVRRVDLLRFLDDAKIGTRLLFAGNLVRQPYMIDQSFRISGELKNTDIVMQNTFWIGLFPGLTTEMLDYVCTQIETFFGLNF